MKRFKDPLTGDQVGPVERLTLGIQGVMRKWRFILAYTALTVTWWVRPTWFGDTHQYIHYQLAYSYLALLIESVIGIGMFSWARRDSQVLRKIHILERKAEHQDENHHVLLHEILRHQELTIRVLREQRAVRRELENGNGHDTPQPG